MIDLDPKNLMAEIKGAEELRKQHLQAWGDVCGRMAGAKYRNDFRPSSSTPENYPFAYIASVRPQLVYDNPVVEVAPDRSVTDWATADGLEVAMNHWIKTTHYKFRVINRVVDDCIIGFGVTRTTLQTRGDYGGSDVGGDFASRPLIPSVSRVSPRNFIIDPDCGPGGPSTARFVGHMFERDIEDLQNDDRYDPAATATLSPMGVDQRKNEGNPFPDRQIRESDRKRVTLYELYLPEHGVILTIADRGDGVIIRNEPYYGPKDGPYTLWGLYVVPDQVYPLSPLVACWEQFAELQDHATQAAISAASHKKFATYDLADKQTAEAIEKVKSGELVGVKDGKSVQDHEIGGASDTQYNYVTFLRERLDKALGFSDTQRGIAGGETATAESLAASGASIRTDGMRQQVEECCASDLRKVGWYMFHSSDVVMNISRQNEQTGQMQEGVFIGGPWQGGYLRDQYVPPEDPDTSWPDFGLSIKTMSMTKTDDAILQKRMQDEWQLTMTLSQIFGPQAINWRRMLDRYGRAYNERDFSKVILLDQMGMQIAPDVLGMMPSQFPMQGTGQQQFPAQGLGAGRSPQTSGFGANAGMRQSSPASFPGLMANAMGGVR